MAGTAIAPALARRYDMVVGGAGPGGLAAAIEAKLLGLDVAVVEMRPEQLEAPGGPKHAHGSRTNHIYWRSSSVRAMQRWGVASQVFDGRAGFIHQRLGPLSDGIAPIGHVERALLRRARELGIPVFFSTSVDGVDELSDAAYVRTSSTGSGGVSGALRGMIYVEARGKTASQALLEPIGAAARPVGPQQQLLVGNFAAQPQLPASYRHPRVVASDGSRTSLFWFASRDGFTITAEAPRGVADMSRSDRTQWLRDLAQSRGVAGEPASVRLVEVQTARPGKVRAGRIAVIGDAAGTVHPLTGHGANQALSDARDAAVLARRLASGAPASVAGSIFSTRVGVRHAAHAALSCLVILPRVAQLAALTAALGGVLAWQLATSGE